MDEGCLAHDIRERHPMRAVSRVLVVPFVLALASPALGVPVESIAPIADPLAIATVSPPGDAVAKVGFDATKAAMHMNIEYHAPAEDEIVLSEDGNGLADPVPEFEDSAAMLLDGQTVGTSGLYDLAFDLDMPTGFDVVSFETEWAKPVGSDPPPPQRAAVQRQELVSFVPMPVTLGLLGFGLVALGFAARWLLGLMNDDAERTPSDDLRLSRRRRRYT